MKKIPSISKKIQKKIKNLASPFVLGVFTTLFVLYVALKYYNERGEAKPQSGIFYVLTWIEQKSNDLRMLARGIRPGSQEIAILTIDEKSLEHIGHWPWSRDKIAQIIEKMLDLGAKNISFDIIFSEEDKNATVTVLQEIKKSLDQAPTAVSLIDEKIAQSDTDRVLVNTVKKHSKNIVMGTYYDPSDWNFEPYQNLCVHQAYSKTRAFQNWEKEASLIVTDSNDEELPSSISKALNEVLMSLSEEKTKKFMNLQKVNDVSTLPFNLKQILETEIYNSQLEYCQKWLNPKEDPQFQVYSQAWMAQPKQELATLNFDQYALYLKNKILRNPITEVGRWWMNFPKLAEVTDSSGFFFADLDNDGTIRKSPLLVRSGNQYVPSISFRSYLNNNNFQAQVFIKENPKSPNEKYISELTIADSEGNPVYKVPVDGKGRLTINYAGPRHMFSYLSAADVLNDSPDAEIEKMEWEESIKSYISKTVKVNKKEFIKNKTFFFGATATGIYDLRVTPFSENYPGVETHANVLDNLMRKDFLHPHPEEEMIMLLFLTFLGLALSFVLSKLGAVSGLFITIISLAGLYFFDKIFFFSKGYVVSIFFPMFMILMIYTLLTFYKYFTEERKKKALKGTFSKYVSPSIVEEILKDPDNLQLGGRKEHMTVIFSDIRGFTTISEKLDPSELSDLLNSYLTPMTRLVFEHKGTLDKYMGDAIMAFFGAPIHFKDHASHACRCALSMIEKLKELQAEYVKKNLPMIDIGIGLNTGEMSVGNMGSDIVRSYTVMGDAVNLGSRLEGINKQYGTRIIISEFTYNEIKDSFFAREVDWVRVKGKKLPVRIYELVSELPPKDSVLESLHSFQEGFERYHQKEFNLAIEHFNKALSLRSEDHCSELYIERCQLYLKSPPPPDWDGVYTMTTK